MVEIRLLGPIDVTDDGETLSVRGPRLIRLLVALASDTSSSHSEVALRDAVWPSDSDQPEDPVNAPQTYVSRLRSAASFRYAGADVRYLFHSTAPPQPHHHHDLSDGDPLDCNQFPVVWRRPQGRSTP